MELSKLGEFGLIEHIRKMMMRRSPSVLLGIGDDAAALKFPASASVLATTDMLIEGIHFDLAYTDYYSLGWKSVAVNLSDIAAMGGLPRFCLTSLGIPPAISVEHVIDFYRGCNAALQAHQTILVGGDTCSSQQGIVISVTMLGETNRKREITRTGAKPGDRIFVTGTLGDSAAGLEILKSASKKGGARGEKNYLKRLTQKHLRPVPRIEWGRKIARSHCAHAMIDISDGLSSDLAHICEQSGVGAIISAEQIPLSRSLVMASSDLKKSKLDYALSGGEDYELLFTAPSGKVRNLHSLGIPLVDIGEITQTRKLSLVDSRGVTVPLKPMGYNHFARTSLSEVFKN